MQNKKSKQKISLDSILYFQPNTPQAQHIITKITNSNSNTKLQIDKNGCITNIMIIMLTDIKYTDRQRLGIRKSSRYQYQDKDKDKDSGSGIIKQNNQNNKNQKKKTKKQLDIEQIRKNGGIVQWIDVNISDNNNKIQLTIVTPNINNNQNKLTAYKNILQTCSKVNYVKSILILIDSTQPYQQQQLQNILTECFKLFPIQKQNIFITAIPSLHTNIFISSNNQQNNKYKKLVFPKPRNSQSIIKYSQICNKYSLIFTQLKSISYQQYNKILHKIYSWYTNLTNKKQYKLQIKIMLQQLKKQKIYQQQNKKYIQSNIYKITQIWRNKVQQIYQIIKNIMIISWEILEYVNIGNYQIRRNMRQQMFRLKQKIEENKINQQTIKQQQQKQQQYKQQRKIQKQEQEQQKQKQQKLQNKQQQKYQNNNQSSILIQSQKISNNSSNSNQKYQKLLKIQFQLTLNHKQLQQKINKKQQQNKQNLDKLHNTLQQLQDAYKIIQQIGQQIQQQNNPNNHNNNNNRQQIINRIRENWQKQLQNQLKIKIKLQSKKIAQFRHKIKQTIQILTNLLKQQNNKLQIQQQIQQITKNTQKSQNPLGILIKFYITQKARKLINSQVIQQKNIKCSKIIEQSIITSSQGTQQSVINPTKQQNQNNNNKNNNSQIQQSIVSNPKQSQIKQQQQQKHDQNQQLQKYKQTIQQIQINIKQISNNILQYNPTYQLYQYLQFQLHVLEHNLQIFMANQKF